MVIELIEARFLVQNVTRIGGFLIIKNEGNWEFNPEMLGLMISNQVGWGL